MEPTVVATTEKVSSSRHQQNAFQLNITACYCYNNREMNEQAYAVAKCPSELSLKELFHPKLLFRFHTILRIYIHMLACMKALNFMKFHFVCMCASLASQPFYAPI